jgi:hypothetical protein
MKTKVNKQWYNQMILCYKKQIEGEIKTAKMQYDRYFNYPSEFDALHKIPSTKIFEYLKSSIDDLGTGKKNMDKFIKKYNPCDEIKIDWIKIEEHIRKNANKINECMDIHAKYDYYGFSTMFFYSAKWSVPITQKNNQRIYRLMAKYCEDK